MNKNKGLKWKSLLVYIDDVIIFSKSFDSHMKDKEEVFKRMSKVQNKQMFYFTIRSQIFRPYCE